MILDALIFMSIVNVIMTIMLMYYISIENYIGTVVFSVLLGFSIIIPELP